MTERRWSEVFGFLRPREGRQHLDTIAAVEAGGWFRAMFQRFAQSIVRALDATLGPLTEVGAGQVAEGGNEIEEIKLRSVTEMIGL